MGRSSRNRLPLFGGAHSPFRQGGGVGAQSACQDSACADDRLGSRHQPRGRRRSDRMEWRLLRRQILRSHVGAALSRHGLGTLCRQGACLGRVPSGLAGTHLCGILIVLSYSCASRSRFQSFESAMLITEFLAHRLGVRLMRESMFKASGFYARRDANSDINQKFRKGLAAIEKFNGTPLSSDSRRQADDYAREILGSLDYAPSLHFYAAMQGRFREGWIPENFYHLVVVPNIS